MGCGASKDPPPQTVKVEGKLKENSCKHLLPKINSTKPKWDAMMSKETKPAAGATTSLMFIADQDQASAVDGGWETKLASGVLTYNGAKGAKSYSLEMGLEATLVTKRGDKSGRGAEYSALEVFDGKLLTMCDRTGNCDEIAITPDGGLEIQPLVDANGKEVMFPLGDGKKDKPLKVEWATKKDGKLFVGSTGKERTDDDGNVVHEGEMWCKWLKPGTFEVEHVDTRELYNTLRKAAVCEQGSGYMIHEGGRWSDVHKTWLFMPRKLSRELYDEVKDAAKCVNLMMAAPENPAPDGSDVAMQEYLEFTDLRGCSDFLYVPGTNDTHLFLIRTEETLEGDLSTYASVIDLKGNVLMTEFPFGKNRKFEGVAEVPSHFMTAISKCGAMPKEEPAPPAAGPLNSAFVFIKPHANVPAVQELVKAKFAEKGITILSEGEITGPDIDSNKYIDQHYYAIASKATIMKPAELNVPTDKFSEFFGEEWATVLSEDRAFNAIDLKAKLGVELEELTALWDATNDGKRIKFGGGFYCGCIEKDDCKYYTFNAFFMQMRGKFTTAEGSIHYYSVEFSPSTLKWADFRGAVLGPTNPASAPSDSLRGVLFSDWQKLGLSSEPNTGDNGVHASASPFEGLAERSNWLKTPIADDSFGKALLAAGVDEGFVKAGTVDPQVVLPGADGKKGSLFDQLEDMDFDDCLAKIKEIAAAN